MNEPRNLLVVKSSQSLTLEQLNLIEERFKSLEEPLNAEIIVIPAELEIEFHNNALLKRIDDLVEVNQALLEYMINADLVGDDQEPTLGASLD